MSSLICPPSLIFHDQATSQSPCLFAAQRRIIADFRTFLRGLTARERTVCTLWFGAGWPTCHSAVWFVCLCGAVTFPTRRPFPLFLGQRAKYRDFVGRNVCEKDTLRECDIVPPAMNGTFPLPILMLESVLDGGSTAFRHLPPEGNMS